MTINVNIFTYIIQKVLWVFDYLDSISIGGLFSLFDLLLAFLIVSAFISLVMPIVSSSSGVRGSM